jgi:hypothetical protein
VCGSEQLAPLGPRFETGSDPARDGREDAAAISARPGAEADAESDAA